MARPTEVTGPDDAAMPTASVDDIVGEYDEERPGRRLSPALDRAVTAVCFAVSAFVLYQVFSPLRQGGQFYLILFLAAALPLPSISFPRAPNRPPAAHRRPGGDGPRPPRRAPAGPPPGRNGENTW